MYSQFDEDVYIAGIIRDQKINLPKTFLDLGAFDGSFLSNSKMFVEQGWQCHLVEPAPDNFAKLSDNVGKEPNVMLYNCGVGLKSGKFYLKKGGMGHPTQYKVTSEKTDVEVRVRTVKDILKDSGLDHTGIGIVSIDIEGMDTAVFEELCKITRPVFVIIESHSKKERAEQLLIALSNDYHLINVLDINMVFIRNDYAKWIPA